MSWPNQLNCVVSEVSLQYYQYLLELRRGNCHLNTNTPIRRGPATSNVGSPLLFHFSLNQERI